MRSCSGASLPRASAAALHDPVATPPLAGANSVAAGGDGTLAAQYRFRAGDELVYVLRAYDADGNYIYPEGFDPETNEWKPGYDEQRVAWEQQYAEAQARWEAHKKQVVAAEEAEQEAAVSGDSTANYSSPAPGEGSRASDEALQALRDKLTGN